jgi:hypothetical protein
MNSNAFMIFWITQVAQLAELVAMSKQGQLVIML